MSRDLESFIKSNQESNYKFKIESNIWQNGTIKTSTPPNLQIEAGNGGLMEIRHTVPLVKGKQR